MFSPVTLGHGNRTSHSCLVVTSTLRIERLALFNFEKCVGHAVETRQIEKLKCCNVHTLHTCARTHARMHRCDASMFIISVPSHRLMVLCTPIPIAVTRDRGGGRGGDGMGIGLFSISSSFGCACTRMRVCQFVCSSRSLRPQFTERMLHY